MQRININSITLGDKRAVFINHKKHSLWYPNMVGHVYYTNLEDARKDQSAYNEFLTLAMYECYDFNARLFTLYSRLIGYKENTYSNTKFFEMYKDQDKAIRNLPNKSRLSNGASYVHSNFLGILNRFETAIKMLMEITIARNLTIDTYLLRIIHNQVKNLEIQLKWYPNFKLIFNQLNA